MLVRSRATETIFEENVIGIFCFTTIEEGENNKHIVTQSGVLYIYVMYNNNTV